jgi:hypothetical protein
MRGMAAGISTGLLSPGREMPFTLWEIRVYVNFGIWRKSII